MGFSNTLHLTHFLPLSHNNFHAAVMQRKRCNTQLKNINTEVSHEVFISAGMSGEEVGGGDFSKR